MKVDAKLTYETIDEIGVGKGMNSRVFTARDFQFAGLIAVKEIPKTKFGNALDEYYREAQVLFHSASPNVVRVYYAGESATDICLAMPFYPAGSLADRIVDGPLKLSETVRVALGVLNGLSHVHRCKFLHLDVKPSNVLFENDGTPLLADFGQSRVVNNSGLVQFPDMYMHAMPPETYLSGTAGIHSDIYQVGLTLYRAVNGEPFYKQQEDAIQPGTLEAKITKGKFPDRNAFLPHVPQRLRTAIRKALRRDPADRYASAYDFIDELSRISFPLDWNVEAQNVNGQAWRARKNSNTELLVRRLVDSSALHSIEVYTVSAAGQRRLGERELWKKKLVSFDADNHLTELFESL